VIEIVLGARKPQTKQIKAPALMSLQVSAGDDAQLTIQIDARC
jgi:hypothetical protein